MVAKRRKATCRATPVVWYIITVGYTYPVIYMFNVAGGHGRYYTKTCMYMYCIMVYTWSLALFMFNTFLHVHLLYTVLLEVCPTTVLTSSKQEDSLKRVLSAYGEGGGCVCERGLTASSCTCISPFTCTKGKWWHTVYVCSFATAERNHVFAAPSVTQCYLIHNS